MRSLLLLLLLCGAAQAGPLQAAKATANSTTNACSTIGDFYWEIGSRSGKLASGQRGTAHNATTPMQIASSTKWLYAAYVAQQKALTADDHKHLHHAAGFGNFSIFSCIRSRTVNECAAAGDNSVPIPGEDGMFHYGGGHMQQHAIKTMGMGAWGVNLLANRFSAALVPMTWETTQVAGGAVISPANYAAFLRKMMTGALKLPLGDQAVCTLPGVCATAAYSPITMPWHYAGGHWVESDGTFSSAGLWGFYPWITADKTLYGIVARKASAASGQESAACGKLIRDAYRTGVAQ